MDNNLGSKSINGIEIQDNLSNEITKADPQQFRNGITQVHELKTCNKIIEYSIPEDQYNKGENLRKKMINHIDECQNDQCQFIYQKDSNYLIYPQDKQWPVKKRQCSSNELYLPDMRIGYESCGAVCPPVSCKCFFLNLLISPFLFFVWPFQFSSKFCSTQCKTGRDINKESIELQIEFNKSYQSKNQLCCLSNE